MDLQHLIVKIPVDGDLGVEPAAFIDLFHRWVADEALPELLIDVADLRHVPDGPGVILVGLEADYALDHMGGVWGLLYRRKDVLAGSEADRVRQAVAAAAAVCLRLENEFADRIRFSRTAFELVVNDRQLAPNTDEARRVLLPRIQAAVATFARAEDVALTPHDEDPRRRFGVSVTTAPLDFASLGA